jgi:hypothetical protein
VPNNKGRGAAGREIDMTWWPGWNSIEGAAKWGDIFFWTGFAFLVLLAGCEIVSKVYSWRKDTLLAMRDDLISIAQDIRPKQTDQDHGEARTRDAEIGGARIPEAQALKTPPESPPAPQFQPQFQPQLQPQYQPPFQLQPQAQPPQATRDPEPIARTPEQVARLQERSPRGLTEAQKKTMVALLAPFRGQKFSVVCIAGDPEGKHIGEEIVTVLRAAGWDFPEGGVAEAAYNKEPIGLSLMVNAGQIMTPSVLRPVALLVKALADVGLMQRNGALADPNIPRDRIEVRIGRNRNPT